MKTTITAVGVARALLAATKLGAVSTEQLSQLVDLLQEGAIALDAAASDGEPLAAQRSRTLGDLQLAIEDAAEAQGVEL